ncbi:MAG: hypothetical protein R6U44_09345 [Archaeoglobaceae archaeon]
MTDEEKTNNSKGNRKEKKKKIIDVLMNDGEWRKRTKFKKKKKEQKPEPAPEQQPAEPQPQAQPEHERGPETQPERGPDVEDSSREEAQPEVSSGSAEPEKKMRIPDSERNRFYLSEIEKNVLRAIVMGDSSVNDIIRSTYYPEVIVKGAIERLVSKDFIDRDLNPTEKIRGVSLKKRGPGFTLGRKRRYRLEIMDVAIIAAIILFLVSLFYYVGVLG